MAVPSLVEVSRPLYDEASRPVAPIIEYVCFHERIGISQASTFANSGSIVAIHGLYEGSISTWTDPDTNVLWLRDLYKDPRARVLLYSYTADALASPGNGSADRILPYATSLVAELCADRAYANAEFRPIIFICHGVGGLLVKRALVSSSSRKAKLGHLRSLYISTYAIMFMGTPHQGMNKESLFLPRQGNLAAGPSQFLISLLKQSEMVREITDMFAPLMKQFAIFNFWEQKETSSGDFTAYIVEEDSAAPAWDNVERCGIQANHSGMTKMNSRVDHGYRVIEEALRRYTRLAPAVIHARRQHNLTYLENERQAEARAILQPPLASPPLGDGANADLNEYFLVNRSPTNYFTGRHEHAGIVKRGFAKCQKERAGEEPNIFVAYGLGGSGKTQFCLKYAWDNLSSYWGVFWIDASNEEDIKSGFASLGQEVGKGASFTAGLHWLWKSTKPWLLVFDNADDPDMDLSKYFPAKGIGHILITTRNPGVLEYATAGHICFRGMDPDEAIALLLKSASPKNESETPNPYRRDLARGIASELGYLALAITQAGTAIRRGIYTLEKYLNLYLGQRRAVMTKSRSISADEANIITTWEVPFQRIVDRPSAEHRDAVNLLHIFAFMHFECISEEILQRSWAAIGMSKVGDGSYAGVLQSTRNGETQAQLRRALRVLYDYSIIDHEPKKRSCSLHPVVYAWARDRLEDSDQRHWLRRTMEILALCISPSLEASGRNFRRLLIPHMDSCVRALRLQYPSYPESKRRAAELEKFACIYAENGLWATARTLQTKILEFRLNHLGKRHGDTISAQRHLALTYWNLFEIKPAITTQLDILKSCWWTRPSLYYWTTWPPWKPNHISYCIALSDLTLTLWLAGERERSQYVGERAVAGLQKRLGPDDPITLTAMFNLARTHLHLGNYEQCHDLLIWVLARRRRLFGFHHPDTLMARNELGILICSRRRNLVVAEYLIKSVLESRKKILGEEHAYTLWSVNDLSKVLCERDRCQEAIKILEEIVPVVERTLGDKHVGMSMTRSNLARAYAMSGQHSKAEIVLAQLLPLIPPQHPDWIHNMFGYVRVRVEQGKLIEAEKDCLGILDKISDTKVIAIDDPRTITIAEELLMIYRKQRRHEDIAALKQRIPGLSEKNFNDNISDVYNIRKGSQTISPVLRTSSWYT